MYQTHHVEFNGRPEELKKFSSETIRARRFVWAKRGERQINLLFHKRTLQIRNLRGGDRTPIRRLVPFLKRISVIELLRRWAATIMWKKRVFSPPSRSHLSLSFNFSFFPLPFILQKLVVFWWVTPTSLVVFFNQSYSLSPSPSG